MNDLSFAKIKKPRGRVFSKIYKDWSLGTWACAFSSVLVKAIGAAYKIPLSAALKAEGSGLYQMIFPLYALLITLSGAYLPQALTKAISGGADARVLVRKSLCVFCLIGAFFGGLLALFGNKIAFFQGNAAAGELYKAIAPAVFICSVIAVLRGAIQGYGSFLPTAVSQLVEQIVKAVSGLFFVYFLGGTASEKAIYAAVAVTVSEAVTAFYLAFEYFKRANARESAAVTVILLKKPLKGGLFRQSGENEFKTLIFYAAPLCAAGLITPLACFLDSVIAVNSLKKCVQNAVSVYGAYAGASETIIALPVGALTAFSSASLPRLCKDRKLSKKLFAFVGAGAFLAGAGIMCFSDFISLALFKSFGEYSALISELLKKSAPNVIFQSLLAASNVVLLSKSKQYFSLFSMLCGLVLKLAVDFTLIKIPKFNVFGLVISDSCFYLLALVLNLGYIIYVNKFTYANAQGRIRQNNRLKLF